MGGGGGAAVVSAATSSPTPTAKLGLKDGKLNQQHQLSACMQLKMSPTMGVTTGQQQQQQQQYYQQRPDVMLMTTGHKLSSTGGTGTNCRLVLPPPNSSAAGAAITATPRYYSPPMATYHIVSSASANSSPTHQQAIRHYIIPPTSVPVSGGGGTHHFMAVPTNMLRFQTSAIATGGLGAGAGGTTSNLSINPLASGSTTTVYFPIVTPAAMAQNPLALSAGTTGQATTTILAAASSLASSAATTSMQQPLVKYHTIQMPHRRKQSLSVANGEGTEGSAREDDETLPPPPPAYQTATIHGIRRAKFLTKPLPQEINTLLHESDISCRHDLSQPSSFTSGSEHHQQQQHQQSISAMPSVTAATTTSHSVTYASEVPMPTQQQQQQYHHHLQQQQPTVNNLYSNTSTICVAATSSTLTNNTNSGSSGCEGSASASVGVNLCESQETTSPLTLMSTNNTATTHHSPQTTADIVSSQYSVAATAAGSTNMSSTSAVDIMEDEEELEQQRLGNCPHGTPSRVPLLTCNTSTSTQEDKSTARSFLHATAATIQRHASGFQRNQPTAIGAGQQRKSMIINSKGECNLHIPSNTAAHKRRNSAICYRDHMDTSEDDEYPLEGENMYKLKNLQHQHHHHPHHSLAQQTDKLLHHSSNGNNDELDNNSLVSCDNSTSESSQLPQVPMLVVLVILIFYVSLGTVIFALWENWSLIDGAYFCFVTLTTIGYGDFVPLRTFQGPEIQLFACCAYLLLGLVLVAMSFSILETQLIWKCKRLAVRLKLTKE
uniref:Potassium channel domain-containing protein n=1 Tax=Stomoxys calcitrans TaxID=35570 RepID=A0A1I8Q811_STOCA